MATLLRVDKLANYKKETYSMLSLLHKLQPMLPKIAQLIFEEHGLDKPTQNLFNNITYYLLFLIDSHVHATLTWPLYDTKVEKAFRSEISGFISDYAAKGLLTDVRPSYLVHPSCFKVSVLIYQLSVLAVKRLLIPKIKGTSKHSLYDEVTEKFNRRCDNKSFVNYMESFNYEDNLLDKLSSFLCRKQCNERIAEMLRSKISECEKKLSNLNPQGYIDSLINGFVSKHDLDERFKSEVLKIKNINDPVNIFDDWLTELDKKLDNIEANWDSEVVPFTKRCQKMQQLSEEIVKRQTGQIERSFYTLEYDPKNDEICTDELQNQVNSCQKYILRNLEVNGKLYFPNLIRAFLISICYILKNNTFGDEIYDFNERMEVGKRDINEVCLALKALLGRVCEAEKKLQSTPAAFNLQSVSLEEHLQIPPLPNLSGLKINHGQYHINFDTFTPLNISKHRFNLHRRGEAFSRPQPKSILSTYHAPKDDFLKTLLSCRVSLYDRVNINQSCNMSIISNIKANETIAECSSGLTRQQITRLLSTNKKSSNKKHKYKHDHHDGEKVKRGGLFNESMVSNDSHGLVRSYSSPNLLDNRESRIPKSMIYGRKLSIMQEDSPPQINLSGITCLNSFETPPGLDNAETTKNIINFPKNKDADKYNLESIQKEFESAISPILEYESHFSKVVTDRKLQTNHSSKVVTSRELRETLIPKPVTAKDLPIITMTSATEPANCFSKVVTSREFKGTHIPSYNHKNHKPITVRELPIITKKSVRKPETQSPKAVTARELQETHLSKTIAARDLPKNSMSPILEQELHTKTETPKTNTALIKKTSSLEKIINRFKQLRSTSIPFKDEDINTIVEEKENFNTNSGLSANRNLLPDLLSPSCSLSNVRSSSDHVNYFDTDEVEHRNTRVSLGTMLGVDHTFLDQFDLID